MIPKIIHYCWFGKQPKNSKVLKCIKSWKDKCPEYEFIEWSEDNFNIDYCTYVRQAYNLKKWAYVSDFVRLYALSKYGGIYLDTDVECIKNPSPLLDSEGFLGFEGNKWIATSVIGTQKKHAVVEGFLKSYKDKTFYLNSPSNVVELTKYLVDNFGLVLNGEYQTIEGFNIYPSDYFSPYDYLCGKLNVTRNTYMIHWYDMSWVDQSKLRRFLSRIYHRVMGIKLK